uniref:Uncharacterized protein MANES_11G053000 n=1 Tax=Rhizophora mucronata TaxID=61149 RepID=A0A2P2LX02_RHIMU
MVACYSCRKSRHASSRTLLLHTQKKKISNIMIFHHLPFLSIPHKSNTQLDHLSHFCNLQEINNSSKNKIQPINWINYYNYPIIYTF